MDWKDVARPLFDTFVRADFWVPTLYGFNFYVVKDDVRSGNYLFGRYEADDVQVIKSLPLDDGIIVDVGANIGFFGLLFAKRFPRSQIYCFDPSKYNECRFKQNLSVNRQLASRISFSRIGISSQPGQMTFTAVPGAAGHAWGRLGENPVGALTGNLTESYSVDVNSLDNFFLGKFDQIKFVKIDVEGHEVEVLKGMQAIIRTQRAIIMFEVSLSYLVDHPGQFQDLFSAFNASTYLPFVPASGRLEPYTWPFARVFNLYMIPASVRAVLAKK